MVDLYRDDVGRGCEQKDWNKLLDQAALTYLDKVKAGHSCLAISPVWSEVNAFTGVLRERLKEVGLLGKVERSYKAIQSLQWTRSLKMQLSNYQIGDVLTFHRDGGGFSKHEMGTVVGKEDDGLILERGNGTTMRFDPRERGHFDVGLSRSLSVSVGEKLLVRANFAPSELRNGDLVTVQEVKSDGSLVLHDGRAIPNHFRQFTHGYASTSHAAQGKTVDHGILIMGEKGIKAANLKQAYVSNSRFRFSQTVFTSEKQGAFDSMARDLERPLALENVKPKEQAETERQAPALTSEVKAQPIKVPPLDWSLAEGKIEIRP